MEFALKHCHCGGQEGAESNGVISATIEMWKFYLLPMWLYLIPKMNVFLAFTEQLTSMTDFSS